MKITKFVHACLLVETQDRTALFDPGMFSTSLIPEALARLDDIFITHAHPDHMDIPLVKALRLRFPAVRITAPADAQATLAAGGIGDVQTTPPAGVRFFTAPHETVKPMGLTDPPQEIGVHYLDRLSHPGDSHHFSESMPILALPVSAPWGSTVGAVRAVLELVRRPQYILPIHDWHWRSEARLQTYERLKERFAAEGITFCSLIDGEPVTL